MDRLRQSSLIRIGACLALALLILGGCPNQLMKSLEQMVKEATTSPHLSLKCLNTSTVVQNNDTYDECTTLLGTPMLLEFEIKNDGDRELLVELIEIVAGSGDVDDFDLTVGNFPLTIVPAASSTIEISFDPVSIGTKEVRIRITHNAPEGDGEFEFVLKGTSLSTEATLSALSVSVGTLTPVFNPGTTAYSVDVDHTVSSIRVTPIAASGDATIKVNGTKVDSGSSSAPIDLEYGANDIYIEVSAAGGGSLGYTIGVTRDDPPSTNANLSNLQLSTGTLTPSFSPFTKDYECSVLYEVDPIGVTAETQDSEATMMVNGTSTASGSTWNMTLSIGSNTCTIVVQAEAGNTNTYTITITRKANAALASLIVQVTYPQGTGTPILEPAFASTTYRYYARVNAASEQLRLTPTVTDPGAASIEITHEGETELAASGVTQSYTAQAGLYGFQIEVSAGTGATADTRTYDLSIYVPLMNMAISGQRTSYLSGDDGALGRGLDWLDMTDSRFQPDGTDIIIDTFTNLRWARVTASARSWQNALDYANTSALGKYWRLPNVHELESLLNYDEATDTWLVSNGFATIYNTYYWTSTSVDETNAYVVNLRYGKILYGNKNTSYYVLIVNDME